MSQADPWQFHDRLEDPSDDSANSVGVVAVRPRRTPDSDANASDAREGLRLIAREVLRRALSDLGLDRHTTLV